MEDNVCEGFQEPHIIVAKSFFFKIHENLVFQKKNFDRLSFRSSWSTSREFFANKMEKNK